MKRCIEEGDYEDETDLGLCSTRKICTLAVASLNKRAKVLGNWLGCEGTLDRLAATIQKEGMQELLTTLVQLVDDFKPKGLSAPNTLCEPFLTKWKTRGQG